MSHEDAINFLIRNMKKNIQPVFKFPSQTSIWTLVHFMT